MPRLLIAYSNSANYVSTTAQYLAAFARYSSWDVRYLHVTHFAEIGCDLGEFDAVLQSYCVRLPLEGYVSPEWIEKLTAFRGLKFLAVQDEYDNTNRLHRAIRDIGFDAVLTCVPEDQIERVYPQAMFPGTAFLPVLTGYVPEGLPQQLRRSVPLAERPITIGYRGRDIGPRYGQLAFDKLAIGKGMKAVCEARGISHDIEWNEGARFYGDAWYAWIGRCRVNLATESGSNVFDWDGEVQAEVRRRNPAGPLDWQSFLDWVAPYEAGYDMGQISPRIFEAAAMGTALVLYPGQYSGILKPNIHYIPLEKDFSNIDEVLRRIDDLPQLSAMTERAWNTLIGLGHFSYRGFVEAIDWALTKAAKVRGMPLRGPCETGGEEMALVDSPALRSLTERPTRQPHSPLVFSFKHLSVQNEMLRSAVIHGQTMARALTERVQEQKENYEGEIADLRRQIAVLTRNAGENHVGAIPN